MLLTLNSQSTRIASAQEANFSTLMGNQPTDVAVVTADGKKFEVHKLVLCAQSRWFEEKFSGGKKGCPMEEIPLDFIAADVFTVVKEFMYQGQVRIPNNNMQEMKKAMTALGITFFVCN
ncbi:unnamed protein product [Allacma fusca]|uniref:BTB domain-containing protein n=1 Tax=Allacma fusca TaxID=39272 RepID=A0A8J2L0V4_9HEXA|nr:unnamed protein product [Allacma fusca]